MNLLFKIEKYILNKCDVISTISGGMVKKVKVKQQKMFCYFLIGQTSILFIQLKTK